MSGRQPRRTNNSTTPTDSGLSYRSLNPTESIQVSETTWRNHLFMMATKLNRLYWRRQIRRNGLMRNRYNPRRSIHGNPLQVPHLPPDPFRAPFNTRPHTVSEEMRQLARLMAERQAQNVDTYNNPDPPVVADYDTAMRAINSLSNYRLRNAVPDWPEAYEILLVEIVFNNLLPFAVCTTIKRSSGELIQQMMVSPGHYTHTFDELVVTPGETIIECPLEVTYSAYFTRREMRGSREQLIDEQPREEVEVSIPDPTTRR